MRTEDETDLRTFESLSCDLKLAYRQFTPNIGAYQGHGSLISAGSVATGDTISGVTLQRFTTNGI